MAARHDWSALRTWPRKTLSVTSGVYPYRPNRLRPMPTLAKSVSLLSTSLNGRPSSCKNCRRRKRISLLQRPSVTLRIAQASLPRRGISATPLYASEALLRRSLPRNDLRLTMCHSCNRSTQLCACLNPRRCERPSSSLTDASEPLGAGVPFVTWPERRNLRRPDTSQALIALLESASVSV